MPQTTASHQRNVHVLFVHGVGTHSRLSSLLQAYQALRADTRSGEAPLGIEDPIPDWKLAEFAESANSSASPRLKLTSVAEPDTTVYLYEVNYSALAGVVRQNQPLDLTALFVGFDLAVNVARKRLESEPPVRPAADGRLDIDHLALARTVQKIAGVFVAATVPILGIPSLVFRRFTQSMVGLYTRFFEDIATFAMDMNGEALIAAHFERTVRSIVGSDPFCLGAAGRSRDELVIAAHSLGTVVAHGYLVRQRHVNDRRHVPTQVLTYGSPIGLVCWLWLLLDFHAMDARRPAASRYFTWAAAPPSAPPPPPLLWINVVNLLDPIATAFPVEHLALTQSPGENRQTLVGGRVHHRYIDTHDAAGTAHTTYFNDREGFVEILSRLAELRGGRAQDVRDPAAHPPDTAARTQAEHWRQTQLRLARLRRGFWIGGLALVAAYLGGLAWLCRSWIPLLLLPAYGYPPLTIGLLAFFQRLTFSRPTKRTEVQAIEALPWQDVHCRPHCMRQSWRCTMSEEAEAAFVRAPARDPWMTALMGVVSFLPTLAAMLLPLAAVALASGAAEVGQAWQRATDYAGTTATLGLALFSFYLIGFAVSELTLHWGTATRLATADARSEAERGAPAP